MKVRLWPWAYQSESRADNVRHSSNRDSLFDQVHSTKYRNGS